MLWVFGGDFYNIPTPAWLSAGWQYLHHQREGVSSGEAVFMKYPLVRVVIFAASVVVGVGMWLLNSTKIWHVDPRRCSPKTKQR